MGPRASKDLRSPSLIMAPDTTSILSLEVPSFNAILSRDSAISANAGHHLDAKAMPSIKHAACTLFWSRVAKEPLFV